MREFVPAASIEANTNYIWVRTDSGYGVYSPDFAAGKTRFGRSVAAAAPGQAVLDALAKSRRVTPDQLHLLTEGLDLLERVRLWEKEEVQALGYKTLRAIYKDMTNVMVRHVSGTIVFKPTRHVKLQAWEGFAVDDAEHADVVIDAGASTEEVGEAALEALSRCA